MLIFELSQETRQARAQAPKIQHSSYEIPASLQRQEPPQWPACSELDVIRHFTRLSHKNFAIDSQFYPLGSCTMKYNPRGVHKAASLPGFLNRHPLSAEENSQGFLESLYQLQECLKEITGMAGVSLTPMAGSQGEFAGVAMIRAYHKARNESHRNEILIPDAAHGTNPASAVMCGYKIIEIPTAADGDMDIEALKKHLGPNTAGIMLTNPSTLGLFMQRIQEVASLVHQAGGLLYYDGANLNAILGKVRPGDMGFDVMHLNLHKTFATPHGGGGPGSGPVAVNARLLPFMPLPVVHKDDKHYRWASFDDYPKHWATVMFYGQCGHLVASVFLHSYFRKRRAFTGVRIRHTQCQLPFKTINPIRVYCSLPQAPSLSRIHH